METETFSFRCTTASGTKIKAEAYKQHLSPGGYIRVLVEDLIKEPEDTRLQMLDHHDILTQACFVLSKQILATEKYLRAYDFEDPDIALLEKTVKELIKKQDEK